jgi:replicative DNA helicase
LSPHDLDPALLPWSSEAEAAVLGSLLVDNAAWDRVGDLLQFKHFYDPAHGLIFTAIASLIAGQKPADPITVYDHLQHAGKGEEVGGIAYLSSLVNGVASASGIRRYSEIVAERALMRWLGEGADKVKELATAPGLTASARLDQAQAVLQALQVGGGRSMPTPIDAGVVRLLDRVQDAADGKVVPSVSTGIPGLDRMIGGGLKGGKQVIIAARPSIGKSSLAEQICLNAAVAGYPAAFFSQEMSKDELTDRAVSNLGRIELDRVISGRLADGEHTRLTEAVERLRNLPLYLDDQPALTLHDIGAKARMLKRQHGIRVIAVDYLQLCGYTGKNADNRHHQLEELSRGIKTLARQLDVCFLSLSQLNREVEKRTSGRPVMSDLKESGAIEEDADVVMLLSRNGATATDGFQVINCDLPKNRQGRVGSLALGFVGAHQQWHETTMPVEFKPAAPRRAYTQEA